MAATASDLTRQQLDELDNLLQRMLGADVGDPHEPEPDRTLPHPQPEAGMVQTYEVPEPEALGALDLNRLREELDDDVVPLQVVVAAEKPRTSRGPLHLTNRAIESTLKLFGPPGELLLTGPAKNLLGLAGVLLLFAAGGWAAYCQGLVPASVQMLVHDIF